MQAVEREHLDVDTRADAVEPSGEAGSSEHNAGLLPVSLTPEERTRPSKERRAVLS
jgi:hypothetical protein